MAKKKKHILNPHSYERIEANRFYIGSNLVGHLHKTEGEGYIWESTLGFQAYDSELRTAISRMRNIFWYRR
jgi:hypothetical protein